MKEFKIILLLIALGLLSLTSCTDDSFDQTDKEEETIKPKEVKIANPLIARSRTIESNHNPEDGLFFGCFSIVYPFNMTDESGNTYEIKNIEDFDMLLLDSTLASEIIDFVYPLNIIHNDESTGTIDDVFALGESFATCVPSGGWSEEFFPAYLINEGNSCYDFVYPANFKDQFGEKVTAASEAEFIDLLATDFIYFSFPLTITAIGGAELEIENIGHLLELLLSCSGLDAEDAYWSWENDFQMIGCYDISFPLSVILYTHDTISVEDNEALSELLLKGEVQEYTYPITLIGFDGIERSVASESELNILLNDCSGITIDIDSSILGIFLLVEGSLSGVDEMGNEVIAACWEVEYPIGLTSKNFDGSTNMIINVNNLDELLEVGCGKVIELNFPINLITLSDGLTVEIGSVDELQRAFELCSF